MAPRAPLKACGTVEACDRAKLPRGMRKRGLRLNMANNPKKVKDPTEVALSAIQEALNITEPNVDPNRSARSDAAPEQTATPAFDDAPFDFRSTPPAPSFEPIA